MRTATSLLTPSTIFAVSHSQTIQQWSDTFLPNQKGRACSINLHAPCCEPDATAKSNLAVGATNLPLAVVLNRVKPPIGKSRAAPPTMLHAEPSLITLSAVEVQHSHDQPVNLRIALASAFLCSPLPLRHLSHGVRLKSAANKPPPPIARNSFALSSCSRNELCSVSCAPCINTTLLSEPSCTCRNTTPATRNASLRTNEASPSFLSSFSFPMYDAVHVLMRKAITIAFTPPASSPTNTHARYPCPFHHLRRFLKSPTLEAVTSRSPTTSGYSSTSSRHLSHASLLADVSLSSVLASFACKLPAFQQATRSLPPSASTAPLPCSARILLAHLLLALRPALLHSTPRPFLPILLLHIDSLTIERC